MKHHEILTNTEKLKETICGLVTLFATCVGILLHITHTSAGGALGLVLGTWYGGQFVAGVFFLPTYWLKALPLPTKPSENTPTNTLLMPVWGF